jgi:tight adherence protein C
MPWDNQQFLLFATLGFAFMAAVLLVAGVAGYVASRRDRLSRRLVEVAGGGERSSGSAAAIAFSSPWWRQQVEQVVGSLSQWNDPKDELERSNISRKISQAGFRGKGSLRIYLGTKVALMTFGLLIGLTITQFVSGLSTTGTLSVWMFSAAVGFYIPNVYISVKRSRRRSHLFKVLPDMVDLLVICMEAGMALSAAIRKVAEEIYVASPDMHQELRLVLLEMETGLSRADALRHFAQRTGVDDINALSGMLIQADKFGTSIARSLRVFAESMRTRRTQKAEEAAAKTPVKLALPLILCIFPVLFIVILAPACIKLWSHLFGPSGQIGG